MSDSTTGPNLGFTSEGDTLNPVELTTKITLNSSELLKITQIIVIPAGLTLITSTLVLFAIVLIHFRHLIAHLYFPLIVFSCSHIYLFVVMLATMLTGEMEDKCNVINSFELSAILSPGIAIFLVTLSRLICVRYPLNYRRILNLPLHTAALALALVLIAVLVLLPLLGVCSHRWEVVDPGEADAAHNYGFCRISGADTSKRCGFYHGVLLGVGLGAPALATLFAYLLIMVILIRHKQTEKSLKAATTTETGRGKRGSESWRQIVQLGYEAVPWSVPVLLMLHMGSTLPWIMFIQDPQLAKSNTPTGIIGVDIVYTVMLLSISISPLIYVVTTPNMRSVLAAWIRTARTNILYLPVSMTTSSNDNTE